MDATFGNSWDGKNYGWPNDWPMFDGGSGGEYPLGINNLLDVVRKNYGPEIKTRSRTRDTGGWGKTATLRSFTSWRWESLRF